MSQDDVRVLLYGYVNSTSNGGLSLGATQHDEFVQAFGGRQKLDTLSNGKWRLFGKTGSGYSSERSRDEAALGGFFCLPRDAKRDVLPEGRLFVFFLNVQTLQGISKSQVRGVALKKLVQAMIPELSGSQNVWE